MATRVLQHPNYCSITQVADEGRTLLLSDDGDSVQMMVYVGKETCVGKNLQPDTVRAMRDWLDRWLQNHP